MTKKRTKIVGLLVPRTKEGLKSLVPILVLGLKKGPANGGSRALVPFQKWDIFSPFSPLVLHAV